MFDNQHLPNVIDYDGDHPDEKMLGNNVIQEDLWSAGKTSEDRVGNKPQSGEHPATLNERRDERMNMHNRAPVPVLVIGTYHMANPGKDWFNIEADDVLTQERQSEIEEVIRRLLQFEPTKVAVESPFHGPQLATRFADIANGAPMLRNEIDQLGIRLALAAEHSEIYGIDVQDVFFDPELEKLVAKMPEHQASWTALQSEGREVVDELSRFLREHSVLETLRYLNLPDSLRQSLAAYLDRILLIFEPENYVGPDMVGNWYRRNLRIFANLTSIASSGDRLVVFYGQGHAPLLSHFISVSTRFILADPLEYL